MSVLGLGVLFHNALLAVLDDEFCVSVAEVALSVTVLAAALYVGLAYGAAAAVG